jgi:hypothetical protein
VTAGKMLRDTVTASAVLAAIAVLVAAVAGQISIGLGLGAGLLIGSLNGHAIALLLRREAPFVVASIVRLATFSAVAILAAILLGSAAWWVLIGVALAQFVMVAAAVRQGVAA